MLSPFTYQSSSCIDYIYSNLKTGLCNVHFKTGKVYCYRNVSRKAILKLQLSETESLGLWFNKHIKKDENTVKVCDYQLTPIG